MAHVSTQPCNQCGKIGHVESVGGYLLCCDCLIKAGKEARKKRHIPYDTWIWICLVACATVALGLILGSAITVHDYFDSKHHKSGMPLEGPLLIVMSLVWLAVLVVVYRLL